jgi:hypothetical protein
MSRYRFRITSPTQKIKDTGICNHFSDSVKQGKVITLLSIFTKEALIRKQSKMYC